MAEFILLKRTYPISTIERECDGYIYLAEKTTEEQRKEWGVDLNNLRKTIKENEKYMYQVGKEDGNFKVFSMSFDNYRIIRKFIYGIADEI
jgi:hypothetical protein